VGSEAQSYAAAPLADPAFLWWEAKAQRETWTMEQWDNARSTGTSLSVERKCDCEGISP
jgi:hypothetical protein